MADIPTNEPLTLRAGLTWKWRREDLASDYPATSWTLKYWLKKTGATGANFSITASADGSNFDVTVPASTTSGYTAGRYTWSAQVTGGSSEAYEVDTGSLEILPRYDQAANLDDRTHARKVLEAIEAVIENRATLDQQEYTIGNRSLKRMTVEELMRFRQLYRNEVQAELAAEKLANGIGIGRKVLVRL